MSVAIESPTKPERIDINAENVPRDLREKPRWVLWRWVWNPKKNGGQGGWDKPPYQLNGRLADKTNPDHWCSFDEALAAVESGKFDGVGFCFTADDDLAGIDLDDCRDPSTGELNPGAAYIVASIASYAEVSPSGTGVKIFVRGSLPQGRRADHARGVEMYDRGSYFCVTGHKLDDTPSETVEIDLVAWHEVLLGKAPEARGNLSDSELALSALNALSLSRCDGYQEWLAVGMALHSISPGQEMLDAWDRWSRNSGRYEEGACAKKWATFSTGPLTLGSLIHWAKQDGWKPPHGLGDRAIKADLLRPSVDGIPGIDRAEGQTEVANANRLIESHPDQFLYVEPMKRWKVFDGKRWADDQGAVGAVLKQQAERQWDDVKRLAPDLAGSALSKMVLYVKASNSGPGISHAEGLVKRDGRIRLANADSFNRHPHLFNVQNGTVDLRTGELRPHDRRDLLTQISSITFDPQAACPQFCTFLDTITAGNLELRSFLQRAAGYSLWGALVNHVLLVLFGCGANGKSVFLAILRYVFGEYATEAAPELLLEKQSGGSHPTERADLFGMRLVTTTEAGHGRNLAEASMKQLTGDVQIKARRMREDFWTFEATHTLWLACNHKPRIHGTDVGTWRRIKLIPFVVTVPPCDQDPELLDKLKAEAAGIFNWCLAGCQEWLADGKQLYEPAIVSQATEAYRSEMDAVGQFLEECTTKEPTGRVSFADVYRVYTDWCARWNKQPLGSRTFAQELDSRGLEAKRGTGGAKMRSGITLVPPSE